MGIFLQLDFNGEATKPQADATMNLPFRLHSDLCSVYKILAIISTRFLKSAKIGLKSLKSLDDNKFDIDAELIQRCYVNYTTFRQYS